MSDAAGTWWLDEAARDWSDAALAATGAERALMPRLVEGSAASGRLRGRIAAPGDSRGLSSRAVPATSPRAPSASARLRRAAPSCRSAPRVSFSRRRRTMRRAGDAGPRLLPRPARPLVPDGRDADGASCLAFASRFLDADPDLARGSGGGFPRTFGPHLPAVSLRRAHPHNDAGCARRFLRPEPAHGRADLAQAVLEGVAFSFADAQGLPRGGRHPPFRPRASSAAARALRSGRASSPRCWRCR